MASLLFGGGSKPTKINQVRINQSVLGFPLPVIMGKAKIQQSLLWLDGMTATAVSQGGGKGVGGGKGGSQWLYAADIIAALCCGPIQGVGDVWSGQSWLSNGSSSESYTVASASSYQYTPLNASTGVFIDAGVGMQQSYSSSQTDLGSGSSVTLSGTDSAPMQKVAYGTTLSTGQYSINPTGNVYNFSSADAGQTVTITYSFALTIIKQQENDLVPAGQTLSVGGSFTFHQDYGVTYYTGPNNGIALTKVTGTPTATGTYSVSGSAPAIYHFAAGDVGAEVQITYQIQNNSAVPTGAPGTLAFSVFEGTQGQAVWSLLTSTFPGAALGYTNIAYVAYNPMSLGYAAEVQENTFEVYTADAYGSGIVDCNPVQCLLQVLTNQVWGLGAGAVPFPTSAIDNGSGGTWGGASGTPGARTSGSTAWNWFAANSFFISPVLDHQDTAASHIGKWLEAGQCSAFMSEGLLKLVPYGDTSTAANGATWLAPTAFAAALDDTCFIRTSENEDPVKISSSPWQDAYNTVQVQWDNRSNQYSPEITPESDQGAINRYGSRIEDPQDWDFIHTLPAATFAASMRVKRNVYTRNTYEFTLPFAYSFLENMDVVSISTSSQWAAGVNNANLGIVNLPVRIVKVVDNPNGTIELTCEDYPFGVHQPSIYNKSVASGQVQANLFADPGDTEVVMFEATNRLTQQQGNQIWIGAAGASDNWGSCNVWASSDGVTYKQVGTIDTAARLGALASTFASGSDPDTVNSLVVNMAENTPALESGTSTDADLGNTLCFVDGEIISYSACAISGQDQYTMGTYIRRGQMGSTISSHASGGLFLRLDDAVFAFTYDPTWAGKTLHFKFQSVNSFGNAAQALSSLTAVSFTVPGKNPGTIDASSGLVINPSQFNVGAGPIGYNPAATTNDGPVDYASSLYTGITGASAAPSGVQSQYTYSRWTGYLVPSVTGQYTLGLNYDGGANLYIAGSPVFQNLTATGSANNSTTPRSTGTILLTAGVYYPIVIEWAHGPAHQACQLIWTPPAGSSALVPTGNLSETVGSVSGQLNGSWWNGTNGLWYPSGEGSVDTTNPLLPTFSPPENAGTGISVVTTTTAVSNAITSAATAGQNATVPGWFSANVYVAGGIVDIFLNCGSNTGYFFRIDGRVSQVIGQILKVTNVTNATSGWAVIGTSYKSANSAAFTGWVTAECYYGNGYLALWVNGTKVTVALDNTYIPNGSSNLYYGSEVNTNGMLAPTTSQPGSTSLNPQGSIIPNQPLPTPTYTTTASSISFSWTSQTMQLSDGSTVTVPSGSQNYTGLSASTTYYFYPYINTTTYQVQWANGSPPPTANSPTDALAANSDGCFSMAPIVAATASSGHTGGGGGGITCPESFELVDVQGKGQIPVGQVKAGDFIKGHSFHNNADVYRKVISVGSGVCGAWRMVHGHKVSPCEPVWDGTAFVPAFKIPGAVFNDSIGVKIMLHVDCDEYDECNFYLVAGELLLIHNAVPTS